jgi:hypothetical protein
MARTVPTRVDSDLAEAAKVAAPAMSRSEAAQISHWARVGRELEMSKQLRHADLVQVVAGGTSYDRLGPREQAVVRTIWAERATELRAGLDLAAEFTAAGRSWTELDADGNVVTRDAAEMS